MDTHEMYRIENLDGTVTGERMEGGGYLLPDKTLRELFERIHAEGWELVCFITSTRAVFRRLQHQMPHSVQIGDIVEHEGGNYRITRLGSCELETGEEVNISAVRLLPQGELSGLPVKTLVALYDRPLERRPGEKSDDWIARADAAKHDAFLREEAEGFVAAFEDYTDDLGVGAGLIKRLLERGGG
jgi:hypothetical protein